MIIEIDGERYDVPDDATPDEIGALTARPVDSAPAAAPSMLDKVSLATRKFFDPGYGREFRPSDIPKQMAKGASFMVGGGLPRMALGGALYGAGSSEGQDPLSIIEDAAIGAGGGALMGKGVQLLGRALTPVSRYLTDKGITYGRKALSGVSSSLARRKPIPEEAVREAFNIGAIRPGSTVTGIAQRLQNAADPLAERYGTILQELEAAGVTGPNAQKLAAGLAAEGATAEASSIIGTRAQALKGAAEALTGAPGGHMRPAVPPKPTDVAGNLGLMQTELMKRELQTAAQNDYAREGGASLSAAARKEIAGRFKDAIEQSVAEQAAKAPEAAASFVPVKEQLHRTLTALNAASEGAARHARRSPFGLHEAMGLASGLAGGNPLEAAGAAGLMSALKERGASTLGSAFYSAGKGVGRLAPEALMPLATPEGAALARALAKAVRRRGELVPVFAQDPRTELEAPR